MNSVLWLVKHGQVKLDRQYSVHDEMNKVITHYKVHEKPYTRCQTAVENTPAVRRSVKALLLLFTKLYLLNINGLRNIWKLDVTAFVFAPW